MEMSFVNTTACWFGVAPNFTAAVLGKGEERGTHKERFHEDRPLRSKMYCYKPQRATGYW